MFKVDGETALIVQSIFSPTTSAAKTLVRFVELPSIAFIRDSNGGNTFLKINTIDGRLFSRLRIAIQEYETYASKKGVKKNEKNN